MVSVSSANSAFLEQATKTRKDFWDQTKTDLIGQTIWKHPLKTTSNLDGMMLDQPEQILQIPKTFFIHSRHLRGRQKIPTKNLPLFGGQSQLIEDFPWCLLRGCLRFSENKKQGVGDVCLCLLTDATGKVKMNQGTLPSCKNLAHMYYFGNGNVHGYTQT